MDSLNQAKGNIALTEATSDLCTAVEPRSWRLLLVVFLVRMWRLNAWPRLIDPLPRTLKRLAALFLVFIFGMMTSRWIFDHDPRRSPWHCHRPTCMPPQGAAKPDITCLKQPATQIQWAAGCSFLHDIASCKRICRTHEPYNAATKPRAYNCSSATNPRLYNYATGISNKP